MALVLMRDGYSAEAAVTKIREQRGERALCNTVFENWLLTKTSGPTFQLMLVA